MTKQKFTPVEKIGRSRLIEKISMQFERHDNNLIYGIGDDSAVVKPASAEHQLLTSELFTEGVDFNLTYTPLQHLGFKLVSLSVSDIYAMNGKPDFLLVNLGLTNKISVEMTETLYQGIKSACLAYGIKLAGGDIGAATGAMTVSMSITGHSDHTVYRSGAKDGDAICVTGDLGGAACGLMVLLREKKHFDTSGEYSMQPELEPYEYVVRRQLVPEARLDLIETFESQNMVPTSMTDLTKGLNKDLLSLCEANNLGAMIYEAAIPVNPATRFAADELEEDIDKFVLFGGEEPEIMFTLPEGKVEEFATHFKDFVVIGRIRDKSHGVKMQTAEGHTMTLH